MSLLGIRVGISECRAVAVSVEGEIHAHVRRTYQTLERANGLHEFDLHGAREALYAAIHIAVEETARDPIEAICITAMGDAMAPLSPEGQITGQVLVADARGAPCVVEAERRLGRDRLYALTGSVPDQGDLLGRLCWMRDNEPRRFWDTWRFVLPNGLMTHLLGGAPTCDYSLAGSTLLFGLYEREWAQEILKLAAIPGAKLPELDQAGTPVGTVSRRAAQELGLQPNTLLVLGGRDLCCDALGCGVIESGDTLLHLGPSVHLLPVFEAIPLMALMQQHGLSMTYHVVPHRFVTLIHNQAGGRVLQWFVDTLLPVEKKAARRHGYNLYTRLLDEMPDEPTRLLSLPNREDDAAPSAPAFGTLVGLEFDTSRGALVKGLLEGVGYRLLDGQTTLEEIGIRVERYRVGGIGARYDRWLQLLADMLGRPVTRTALSTPAPLGAAILAGIGLGVWPHYKEAVRAMVRPTEEFTPDERRHGRYARGLATYRRWRARLSEGDAEGA